MTLKTPKEKWVWMPHNAHLIIGHDCRFVLATRIGKYIVSTVGEYWPDRQVREIHAEVHDPEWHAQNRHRRGDDYDRAYMKRFGFDDIGLDSKYETMVFKSKRMTVGGCPACPYMITNGSNIDGARYKTPEDAYAGHMRLCLIYAKK